MLQTEKNKVVSFAWLAPHSIPILQKDSPLKKKKKPSYYRLLINLGQSILPLVFNSPLTEGKLLEE